MDELTVLGIKIGSVITNVTDYNIEHKLPTIKKTLEQWQRRNLSPIGRICIVKTILLSKLVHLFIALPNPSNKLIKELERMFFSFVWGHKKDKIKRTKLIETFSEDGLKMIHIDSFIKRMKLTWLKRFTTSRSDWHVLAEKPLPEPELLLTYSAKKLSFLKNKVRNPFL